MSVAQGGIRRCLVPCRAHLPHAAHQPRNTPRRRSNRGHCTRRGSGHSRRAHLSLPERRPPASPPLVATDGQASSRIRNRWLCFRGLGVVFWPGTCRSPDSRLASSRRRLCGQPRHSDRLHSLVGTPATTGRRLTLRPHLVARNQRCAPPSRAHRQSLICANRSRSLPSAREYLVRAVPGVIPKTRPASATLSCSHTTSLTNS